ncbi:MAG: hypothetical protein JST11_08730 [Acidobacteria bacterium]|nr:hypothetical protein [Acidobacteriota bacterium]
MRTLFPGCLALVCALFSACSSPPPPVAAPKVEAPPKITQLYAPQPAVGAGETAKICYGVENARSVWITPPMRELSRALTRCIEVEPARTTTYTLTAEGGGGTRVSQDITIAVGPPRVSLVNVNVSAVDVRPGDAVTICYTVANARGVTIEPPGFHGGSAARGCVTHRPAQTTTYVVTATGADGEHDREEVTVRVR